MPYSKRRGSRDFNYAGLDGDGDDVPVGAEDVDPEDVCPQCSRPVSNWDPAIRCDSCETWNHAKCEGMSEIEYEVLIQSKGMGLIRVASSLTKGHEDRIWCCFDETS